MAKRKPQRTRGVRASERAERAYYKKLNQLISRIAREVRGALPPPETRDAVPQSLNTLFAKLRAELTDEELLLDIATSFVSETDRLHRRAFARTTGITVYAEGGGFDKLLRDTLQANVELIAGMAVDLLDDLQPRIAQNIRNGRRSTELIPEIEKRLDVSRSRAKLIARDQTAKVSGELARTRQQAAGFDAFRWRTSSDNRVRDRHAYLARQDVGFGPGVYRWDDLPTSDTGERISPGSDFQCRCTAEPRSTGGS